MRPSLRVTQVRIFRAFHSRDHGSFRIQSPPSHIQDDVLAWQAAIDPYLPSHLQKSESGFQDISNTITSADLSCYLRRTQDASLDILSHLGLVEERWSTVVWIAKKVLEGENSKSQPLGPTILAESNLGGKINVLSLDEITQSPIRLQRDHSLVQPALRLDHSTEAPDSINRQRSLHRRGLGQLWRSLGNMVLFATESDKDGQSAIMPYVLEIVAHMHHVGFMPEVVYKYQPRMDQHALQQPPTLHMLSSKILIALSNATWKAHEASVKAATTTAKAGYTLGHEKPGARYKVWITAVTPELWLELILWSCLHGGWIEDGAALLKQLANKKGEQRWGLLSWREIIHADNTQRPEMKRLWKLFGLKEDSSASPEDREKTRRTISGEVVVGFIDGLVNQVRLGVGARGTNPESLLASIVTLKAYLSAHNLSLGHAVWDSIVTRLLDSGGFVPEKRPELLLRIFDLAAGFASEISAANATSTRHAQVAYFYEPTTVPLNLLHRAGRAFVALGDINGAMTTLSRLQRYTDNNKQESVRQFFEVLRTSTALQEIELFTQKRPPVDFPAFDIKLPVPLLAKVLELVTEAQLYDLGRWMVYSEDLDGPMISPKLYDNRNIAAALVRFGTLANEHELVLKVIKQVETWNKAQTERRLPAEILTVLLCCQIKLHNWNSIQGMQIYVQQSRTFRPKPVILSTFAAELVRTSNGASETMEQAQDCFKDLLFGWENLLLSNIRNELYCCLALMSSVAQEWQEFCSQFLAVSISQTVKFSTVDFNQILEGILDSYGSSKGRKIVQMWCYEAPQIYESYRAPGGLPNMPRFRVSKAEAYLYQPQDIEILHGSGTKVILKGRVLLDRQTVWAVLRKVRVEIEAQPSDAIQSELRETIRWAVKLLNYLGFDAEDIRRQLGSQLLELAEQESTRTATALHVSNP